MITEGVIPIAAVDPLRVIASCTIGAAIGGGLSMSWGVGSPVPSGGVFIIPAMTDPLKFTIALLIGSAITGILLFVLKKEPVEEVEDVEEEEVDFSSIKIS
jgi:PTS system fructose-specific IIC component